MNVRNGPGEIQQTSRTLIVGLQRADAFPHDVLHIETLETHISFRLSIWFDTAVSSSLLDGGQG